MAAQYYGQNPTSKQAVLEQLGHHLLANPELHWAVLLDSAFDYEDGIKPDALGQHINCYSGLDALDDLAPVAPCLFKIDATSDGRAMCDLLLEHASGRPMLSIVASDKPLKDLAKAWAPLHWVYSSEPGDKQRFALRIADTRSLKSLSTLLTPQQWQALTAPLAFWFLVNRAGQLEALPAAPVGTQAVDRIAVSAKTLGKMVEQALPDTLLQQIVDRAREDIDPAQPRLEVFKMMQDTVAIANDNRLGNMDDIGALAYCAVLSKGAVLQHEKVLELLRDKSFLPGSLGEAIAETGALE